MGRHLANNALAKVQGNIPLRNLTKAEKGAINFYIESRDVEAVSEGEEQTSDRPLFASISAMAYAQAEAE
jgi:hypothetical protein